ncbi:MAG: M48 family metalloprotease [Pseudomonadota bacterium]
MENDLSRRDFLRYTALTGAGIILGTGCATNPVTGKSQLMVVSEQTEISLDKSQSPHQFSADYGRFQDEALQQYLDSVGRRLVPHTHRPHMPYSFQCVNATYINAYAFPGGSIAATRGILLKLDSEAELTSLLGHELGHVNARHAAQQMSKSTVSSVIVGGLAAVAGAQNAQLGDLTKSLGALGQGLLLARYSRDNEREADSLGNGYMVKAGYSTQGFVDLMAMLNSLNSSKSSSTDMLFATHPMSSERYDAAVASSRGIYGYSLNYTLGRESYMDHTASLRKQQDGILALQEGEALMGKKEYAKAEERFRQALVKLPRDYAGNLMLAQCLLAQEKPEPALQYVRKAQDLFPGEAQSLQTGGIIAIRLKQFDRAYDQFKACDAALPGNPAMTFFMGYSQEGMTRVQQAAGYYRDYLGKVREGQYAEHAYQRLKEWGAL